MFKTRDSLAERRAPWSRETLALCLALSFALWGCVPDHPHPELAQADHTHAATALSLEGTALLNNVENLALEAYWYEPGKWWDQDTENGIWVCMNEARVCLAQAGGEPFTYQLPYTGSQPGPAEAVGGIRWFVNTIQNSALEAYRAGTDSSAVEGCLRVATQCLKPMGDIPEDESPMDCPWPTSGGRCKPAP